ncbi:MAG: hypothetical protein SFU83_05020 [Meiothermus sp.]|nr:hypothetical protein [Meiothermus sp.]
MRRVIAVTVLLGFTLAATPYSYSAFKAELTRQTQNKGPAAVLSLARMQQLLPTGCGGQRARVLEATARNAGRAAPPLVVLGYGPMRVTLVDYGGLRGADRLRLFDIGPRLYDTRVNPKWKTPTLAYRPNPRAVGFGYRAADNNAEIRLAVGGRFDLRLEQFNATSMKALEGCLGRVNMGELLRVSR